MIVLLLLAAVFAEVATLVIVGSRLGALPTLGLVVAAFLIGSALLRGRGIATVQRAMGATTEGNSVTPALVDGLLLAIAGILFIIPGFVSDVVALLLLVPPIRSRARDRVVAWLHARVARLHLVSVPGRGVVAADDVIDVDATEVGDRDDDPRRLSN